MLVLRMRLLESEKMAHTMEQLDLRGVFDPGLLFCLSDAIQLIQALL